jgi:hypothetical protein
MDYSDMPISLAACNQIEAIALTSIVWIISHHSISCFSIMALFVVFAMMISDRRLSCTLPS